MKRHAVAAAAAVFLAGCGVFPREEQVLAPPLLTPPVVVYDTVEARRGTIEDKVTVIASLVPSDLQALFFRWRSGRLRAVHASLGDELKAGALVAELDTGSLENRIARLKLSLRKAEITSERAVALNRDRYERELASIDVDLARLDLADAQAEMESSRLYASSAGVVVYVCPEGEGDSVDAFRTIVQIADPRRLQLVYKGEKASSFRAGMTVSVQLKNREVTGEVIMAPGSTPPDAPEDLRLAVVIRLRDLPAGAQRGDTASISMILARRENVIVIPRDLVHLYLGRSFVQVLKDGVKTERTVELGLQTTTEVEVVSGLAAGELIVSR
jgi:membrane fusion protein, macrolide-specific efflux system